MTDTLKQAAASVEAKVAPVVAEVKADAPAVESKLKSFLSTGEGKIVAGVVVFILVAFAFHFL